MCKSANINESRVHMLLLHSICQSRLYEEWQSNFQSCMVYRVGQNLLCKSLSLECLNCSKNIMIKSVAFISPLSLIYSEFGELVFYWAWHLKGALFLKGVKTRVTYVLDNGSITGGLHTQPFFPVSWGSWSCFCRLAWVHLNSSAHQMRVAYLMANSSMVCFLLLCWFSLLF